MSHHIAIDLGAESGRIVLGTLTDGRVAIEVIHRFPTPTCTVDGHLRWNLPVILAELATGLKQVAERGIPVDSIGACTWGVDYGLINGDGTLIELPCHYRDDRTGPAMKRVHARIAPAELFARTGIPPQFYNTLYQYDGHAHGGDAQQAGNLAQATALLFMPDLIHHWLSGVVANDHGIAGTSQMLRAGTAIWDTELLARLDLPTAPLGRIVPPGTVLGPMRTDLAHTLGFARAPHIVTPGGHDTACAAAAAPGDPATTAFLSSGTWSILGAICDHPATTAAAFDAGFTNEVATSGRVRLNRNIMGMWLIQETRKGFAEKGREYSYGQLAELAAACPPSGVVLAVDDARFAATGSGEQSMDARVLAWLRDHDHPVPTSDGALIRVIVDGLAAAYARALVGMENITGRRFTAIHIIGGGCQNTLLNQLTADACRIPVIAGPIEATAMGNLLTQAQGLGLVTDAEAARAVVRASSEVVTYVSKG
jgi:rhamnulokinase